MLNKTHKDNVDEPAQTHSYKSKVINLLLTLLLVLILIFIGVAYGSLKNRYFVINNHKLDIIRVNNSRQREKGLGGRSQLNKRQGMLFVYTNTNKNCMWMKDMKFAIDIIWFDSNKKVVSIKQNATPESFPETFCPDNDSQYILEVPAGVVSEIGIKLGDQAKF